MPSVFPAEEVAAAISALAQIKSARSALKSFAALKTPWGRELEQTAIVMPKVEPARSTI